jgi:molybdopterin-guanine dinucleotide biosynthesis protein A
MGDDRVTLTAVLLAGGESRRMGRDKATIEFEGQPLWQRQIGILRALEPDRIFVSSRARPSWLPDDVGLLLDDPPSRGPLGGLTKALAAMRTTHLIALAVDMPFMVSKTLRALVAMARFRIGVVPIIGDRAEPLAAVYPAEALKAFSDTLVGTDFSIQALVRKLATDHAIRLISIPAEDGHFYRSVNEPGDIKEGRFPNRPVFGGGL